MFNPCFSETSNDQQYNIVFIIVDDLRPDMGIYGNYTVKSPNLDNLSTHSLDFNNMYAQIAICAPSRDSMLTCRYIDEFSVYDVKGGTFRDSLPNVSTLPQVSKENGYYTSNVGKFFHFGDSISLKGHEIIAQRNTGIIILTKT